MFSCSPQMGYGGTASHRFSLGRGYLLSSNETTTQESPCIIGSPEYFYNSFLWFPIVGLYQKIVIVDVGNAIIVYIPATIDIRTFPVIGNIYPIQAWVVLSDVIKLSDCQRPEHHFSALSGLTVYAPLLGHFQPPSSINK